MEPEQALVKAEQVDQQEPLATRAPVTAQDHITSMIPKAGTIVLTDREMVILFAAVDETLIEIKPNGIIYLPWMEYVTRLRNAFGLQWAIIPDGKPMRQQNHIYWGFWLVIRGIPYGYAIGEMDYWENNQQMTFGDCSEGSKSNALMRLCKGIGIGLEMWQPSFVKAWKEKYAEQVMGFNKAKNKKELMWRKKGSSGSSTETEEEGEDVGRSDPRPGDVHRPSDNKPEPSEKIQEGSVNCTGKLKKAVSIKYCKTTCPARKNCEVLKAFEAGPYSPVNEKKDLGTNPPTTSVSNLTKDQFATWTHKEMERVGMTPFFATLEIMGFAYADEVPEDLYGEILAMLKELPDKPGEK